ncbi:MAG: M14 family zinc carboxypeptidase [Clostridia bacterium]
MITFKELFEKIENLKNLDDIDFFTVGNSTLGIPIYGVHIGSYYGKQVLVEGALHAREYITSLLLVKQVEHLKNENFEGGIYFVPLMNPDGVKLVLDGASNLESKLQKYLIDVNSDKTDFSLWKANANTVDLNVNFDALWGKGSQNVFSPAPANFVGYYANSEREVNDLIKFTLKIMPDLTLSYHSKGNVIYYGFEMLSEEEIARDLKIANVFALETGYTVIKTENSTGGFSDWVSLVLKIPAFTIEVGSDEISHPITEEFLPEIFEKNKDIPLIALKQIQ